MFDFANFGKKVFDEKVMKTKLPNPVYRKWKETMQKTTSLDRNTADAIAHAMKEWALEQGCTHYCHWFQPLTGATAEKHDAFIDIQNGETILKFSGKNLIKGEPDASSFPNGGLRSTFEARGYTYWDCTSPVFIRDKTLCIPTIFVGFHGETLDTKWPLLKSVDALSTQATRIVNAFGNKEITSVSPYIGLEQEYFLVDRKDFLAREDLMLTGRTLFGAMPSKGQELEMHYFGTIPNRVHTFMNEVNEQLWELGIYAKSQHNEVAPAQFELASIYGPVNIAIDQNQIIMDVLQRTALRHDMVCLLHEKPFKGVNGSGKHNNWSLITNTGVNLLNPSKDPHENMQFLLFISAIIQAIDHHPELVRMVASNAGNDFRLGADEAPPAIVSIFLGNQIEDLLYQFTNEKPKTYEKNSLNAFGISSLSYLPHDNSDRNRTSPVAFTGNKFEFRMLGSSMNAASLNTAINTIVAESLKDIANQLENHKYRQDKRKAAMEICSKIIKAHHRILFDGNGYAEEWKQEAEKRGLPNIKTYVEALDIWHQEKTIHLFESFKIYTREEMQSHMDIQYSTYAKIRRIECKTLLHLVNSLFIPTLVKEITAFSSLQVNLPALQARMQKLQDTMEQLFALSSLLEKEMQTADLALDSEKKALLWKDTVSTMNQIRDCYDAIEPLLSMVAVQYPTYCQLFFGLDF